MDTNFGKIQYSEIKCHPELQSLIVGYWVATSDEKSNGCHTFGRRLIPEGSIDLIMHFGSQAYYEASKSSGEVRGGALFLLGIQTTPLFIRPDGEVFSFGITIMPGAFQRLFSVPAKEVKGQVTLGTDLSLKGLRDLEIILQDTPRDQIIDATNNFFLRRIGSINKEDKLVSKIFGQLHCHHEMTIEQICSQLKVSRQWVNLCFNNSVGCSLQEYLAILKLKHVLTVLNSKKPLVDVALECGFYDQPQMSRFVKTMTGHAPGMIRKISDEDFHQPIIGSQSL